MIEEFKLNREELEERIKALEEEISQREMVNQVQLEQQDREQIEGKNKYKTTLCLLMIILTSLASRPDLIKCDRQKMSIIMSVRSAVIDHRHRFYFNATIQMKTLSVSSDSLSTVLCSCW